MTFAKKKETKIIAPVGTLKGSRMGVVHGYFCTNCNYGFSLEKNLVQNPETCPKCNATLNWNDLV